MCLRSVLVTGGTGFIGRHFCRSALARGMRVTVLTRDVKAAKQNLPPETRLCGSLDELRSHDTFQIVVNLAGEPLAARRWNTARKQSFYTSRVGFTDRLVTFFKNHHQVPDHVISGSAVGFYGPSQAPLDETSSPIDSFSHRLCRDWESSARAFEALGSRVCCLRTGIVLGEQGALSRMLPAFKVGLGGPLGSGEQWMSWIHRDDMVASIHHCIDHVELRGPVNATALNPVTNRQFTRALGVALQRPTILPMPAFMARLLFGEMADELLLQGQNVRPAALSASGFKFLYPQLEVALSSLLVE